MSRRIDVELTSERDDGTWTWRAAGARQPKGVLDGALLHPGAKVGDVIRAEADFDIDGITVIAVLPPKEDRAEPERLQIIGPPREFTPVTSTLTGRDRGDRPPRDRDGRRDRDGERRPRQGPRPDRADRRDRPPRPDPGDRPARPSRTGRPDRADRAERGADEGAPGPRAQRGPRRERPAPPPPRPKAKKLRPRRTRRDALLADLAPEQQPIAEQLLRGGMPAVRTALTEQNAKARAEGKPEAPVTAVLTIAEDLLPRVRVADWLDRAEAAADDAEEISLRDLRSVVVSADDVARDDTTRELAARLRTVLERRAAAEQEEWLRDITQSLDAGRVVRALRLSSRPPEPSVTFPPELATRLTEAAGAALAPDIAADRWATVLDAVAYSPVRRTVTPAGAPAEPGDELLGVVRKHAGRVPAAAALFGVEAPAAPSRPGRSRTAKSRPPGALSRPSRRGPAAPIPNPVTAARSLPPGIRRIPPPPGVRIGASAPDRAVDHDSPEDAPTVPSGQPSEPEPGTVATADADSTAASEPEREPAAESERASEADARVDDAAAPSSDEPVGPADDPVAAATPSGEPAGDGPEVPEVPESPSNRWAAATGDDSGPPPSY